MSKDGFPGGSDGKASVCNAGDRGSIPGSGRSPGEGNVKRGLPTWCSVKNLPANAGDSGDISLIPGSGRSFGGGNGNPLKYSCLENCLDRGA